MTALVPWSPARDVTVWLDPHTGRGLDDDGRTIRTGNDRGTPSLVELLDVAQRAGASRVMLVGRRPAPGFLLVRTPGWTPGAHYLDADTPAGRFEHAATGHRVELRRAAEWLGDVDDAATARDAWALLAHVYGRAVPGGKLHRSPGATGIDAWVRSLSRGAEPPEQLDAATADLVRRTSPQHRVELVTPDDDRNVPRQLPGFWYLDGRLMYAALTRELGCAPITRRTGRELDQQLVTDPRAAYVRARYRVRATVPDGWEHVGAFMAPAGDDPRDGWHAPREPGQTLITWCDAAELHLARSHGWRVEILDGYTFARGRPLDTWTERLLRARRLVDELGADAAEPVRVAARAALRAILLHGIGAFHSTGRDVTRVVDPMSYTGDGQPELVGDVFVVRERSTLTGRAAAVLHPEWSSQVWGRAHARILESPTATRGLYAGAWYTRPGDVLGIRGDALYLTARPRWADPAHDDGRPGRLRVKGHLHSPGAAPRSLDALNRLRAAAEGTGATCADCR